MRRSRKTERLTRSDDNSRRCPTAPPLNPFKGSDHIAFKDLCVHVVVVAVVVAVVVGVGVVGGCWGWFCSVDVMLRIFSQTSIS